MKIRSSFVSNSSSSSFVVINARGGYIKPALNDNLVVGKYFGCSEFGWGPEEDIGDFGSRVIWAYLQSESVNNKYLQMIEKVIKENSNVQNIEWKVLGYIDHQSKIRERPENEEIFKSKEVLKDFLFGADSYIHVDNDNH